MLLTWRAMLEAAVAGETGTAVPYGSGDVTSFLQAYAKRAAAELKACET